MVNLDIDDRHRLIEVLKDVPELANDSSRRLMVENSGLKQLVSQIQFDGAQFIAISSIVNYLANYGRLTYQHEALGLFLNYMKKFVDIEEQCILDELLVKYDMMTPVVPSPTISDWRSIETSEDVFEKVIGENTLRPIAFLIRALQVARSVAYVGVNWQGRPWSGTGFLVASDLLITNYHVVPQADLLASTIFRFNYEEDFGGRAQKVVEYNAKKHGLYHSNKELDYALIEVDGEPGKEWGWLPLRPITIRLNARVNIIQHPSGRPKHVSLQNNFVEYVDNNILQYVTSTEPGASGSPVLNDGWEVVAVHHAGGNLLEPTSRRRYFRNEGIAISAILADLPLSIRDRLQNPV